jgi:hypothetical protein
MELREKIIQLVTEYNLTTNAFIFDILEWYNIDHQDIFRRLKKEDNFEVPLETSIHKNERYLMLKKGWTRKRYKGGKEIKVIEQKQSVDINELDKYMKKNWK